MANCRSCDEVLDHLYEYINTHDVPVDLNNDIKAHLDACRQCFSHYEFEQRLIERLRCCETSACPDALRQKIQNLVQKF